MLLKQSVRTTPKKIWNWRSWTGIFFARGPLSSFGFLLGGSVRKLGNSTLIYILTWTLTKYLEVNNHFETNLLSLHNLCCHWLCWSLEKAANGRIKTTSSIDGFARTFFANKNAKLRLALTRHNETHDPLPQETETVQNVGLKQYGHFNYELFECLGSFFLAIFSSAYLPCYS